MEQVIKNFIPFHFELCHHKWCNNRTKKTNGGPLNKFLKKILSFSVSLASNPTSEGCLEERVLMKACQNLCYCDREFWQVQFQIPNSTLAATLMFSPFPTIVSTFHTLTYLPVFFPAVSSPPTPTIVVEILHLLVFSWKIIFFAKLQKRSPHAKYTFFI